MDSIGKMGMGFQRNQNSTPHLGVWKHKLIAKNGLPLSNAAKAFPMHIYVYYARLLCGYIVKSSLQFSVSCYIVYLLQMLVMIFWYV